MRELAASQDTTTNAIYTLFGGKDQLIEQVVDSANSQLVKVQIDAIGDVQTLASLSSLARAYREWALAHPELYRILFVHSERFSNTAEPDRCNAVVKPLQRLLNDLDQQGKVIVHDVEGIALTLWASLHGWIMFEVNHIHEFDDIHADDKFERHIHFFLQGIMPHKLVSPA